MNALAVTLNPPFALLLALITIMCVLLIILLLVFIRRQGRTKRVLTPHTVPYVPMMDDHHLQDSTVAIAPKNFTSAEIPEWRSYQIFRAYFQDPSIGWKPGPHEEESRQARQNKRMLLARDLVHSCGDGACKERWCMRCGLPKCEQEFRVKGRRARSTACLSCRTLQSKLIALHICEEGTCEGEFCPACGRLRCQDYFRKNPRKPQRREPQCIECDRPGYAEFYETRLAQYENLREGHRKIRQAHMKRAKEVTSDTLTEWEWNELKARYEYRCLRCGRKEPAITLTKDHIIPISAGGLHCVENIQPLCQSCNSQKQAQSIDYRPLFHLRERGGEVDQV